MVNLLLLEEVGRMDDQETNRAGSGLIYYGTSDEVRLGDRVEVRGWFGVKYRGYVSYIPGLSPKHRELEYEGVRQWTITADDGTVYAIGYSPEGGFQPRKHIRLLNRGEGNQLKPTDMLC
jgi:hypothetical protein